MAKKAKNEAIEMSNDTFKFWSENALSSVKSFSDMFKFGEQNNANQMNEAFTKNIRSYMKMYDCSSKGMLEIMRESFEAGRKSITGEEMEIDALFATIDKARGEAAAYLTDILSDTPFEGLKEIDKAIKQSVNSFSNEQETAKAFVREICGLNAKLAKLSVAAMRESANTVTAIREDGTVTTEAYKKLVNEYGDTFKNAFEKMAQFEIGPVPVMAGYREKIDNTVTLANKNLEIAASWIEMNLKAAKAVGKTITEKIALSGEKTLAIGEKEAWEDLFKSWREIFEKTTREIVASAQYDVSIPKFIGELADYMKMAGEQCKKAMAIPTYAKAEDLKKISEELAEIKKISVKRAE